MCTKFQVDILKKYRVWYFESRKWRFFRLFPEMSTFSYFQMLSGFGRSKGVLRSFFAFLTKNCYKKHALHVPNIKVSVWPFLHLVTLNVLDLEYAHRKLRMILRRVPDTIHIVVLTISIWYDCRVRQNQISKNKLSNIFFFGMICNVFGDPEVNNFRFPSITFPDLSNTV